MLRILQTVQAECDLDEIWLHIALDNIVAADALLDAVDHSCRQLARQTMMGRPRPELAPELRSFAVKRYVVFYLPMPEGISVIRVLHGARDIYALADQGGFEP